ncbi:hypothetical protein [Konateibacter massiliensis]|uniref:hypothetical protein n=1 Tax=Konateibacter massiliensis TaxID=2002841 RepID=UPI000C148E7F|nr:hypothetical protein [Konateibacter massiliensis]
MGFIKKQAAGFYLTVIAVILAAAGIVFYLINCNTAYFVNFGVKGSVIACAVIAIVLEIAFIAASTLAGEKNYFDILPVASAVLLVTALVTFISSRVNSIASIMTFENNAQTMSDLSSAIIGMVLCLLAVIVSVTASFFKVVKE